MNYFGLQDFVWVAWRNRRCAHSGGSESCHYSFHICGGGSGEKRALRRSGQDLKRTLATDGDGQSERGRADIGLTTGALPQTPGLPADPGRCLSRVFLGRARRRLPPRCAHGAVPTTQRFGTPFETIEAAPRVSRKYRSPSALRQLVVVMSKTYYSTCMLSVG